MAIQYYVKVQGFMSIYALILLFTTQTTPLIMYKIETFHFFLLLSFEYSGPFKEQVVQSVVCGCISRNG